MLLKGFSFDEIGSDGFEKMLKLMNPAYDLPSSDDFKNVIFPASLELYEKKIRVETFLGIISVFSKVSEENMYVIAVVNTMAHKYIFLSDNFINFEDQSLLKSSLLDFFNNCVSAAKANLNCNVHTLIYDCDIKLESDEIFDQDLRYFRHRSLSLLCNELEVLTRLDSTESSQENSDFWPCKQLCDELRRPETCMGHATQLLLEEISNGVFFGDEDVTDTIISYIGAIHMGCNFLIPKYLGKIASSEQLLHHRFHYKIYEFNPIAFQFKDALDHISNYNNKSEIFNYCFLKYEMDAETFWTHARQQCSELAKYALAFLKLPAIPMSINIDLAADFSQMIGNIGGNREDPEYKYVLSLKLGLVDD